MVKALIAVHTALVLFCGLAFVVLDAKLTKVEHLLYDRPRGNCREISYLLSNRRLATNQWEAVPVPICGEAK